MKKKLPKDWQPNEEYFWSNNADKHQMTNYGENRSWCEHQLHVFKMYWCKEMGGSGKAMISWDLTYWNRCKVLWEDVDKRRMYRSIKNSGTWSDSVLEEKEYPQVVESHSTDAPMSSERRKVMPAPKPGKIPSAKIKKAIVMTLKKRIEFADYLSRWRSE